MNVLKKIGLALIIVIALLLVVGLFLPSEYGAERSTVIAADPAIVFDYVNDLRKNELWSPWVEDDPSMEISYGDITVGEGASYSWTSEESGEGTLTIVESVPNTLIRSDLDFGDQGQAEGVWHLKESDEGVKVTWAFSGDAGMNLVGRYFGLMMDSMVGESFERGLAKLKTISESEQMTDVEAGAMDN